MTFSSSDTKPSGTLLSPPTQAHFNSRLSTYTALNTLIAPIDATTRVMGAEIIVRVPVIMRIPAPHSING